MARVQLSTREDRRVIVPVDDIIVNGTVVKQKAVMLKMEWAPESDYATLLVRVDLYANDNGEYGQLISGRRGFEAVRLDIRADENSLVDVDTGELIGTRVDEENPNSFLPEHDEEVPDPENPNQTTTVTVPAGKLIEYGPNFTGDAEKNYCSEIEFYDYLATNMPLVLKQMCINQILKANDRGKFA